MDDHDQVRKGGCKGRFCGDSGSRDLAFTVMGVNFISTVTMVIYPTLHDWLHYSLFEMGVFLGGAIHDVAQVAGAGQTLGPQVLSDAIITKLLRVAFLLPAVTGIAWWVARGGEKTGDARPAPPVFLFGFLALAALNSFGLVPAGVKAAITQVSSLGNGVRSSAVPNAARNDTITLAISSSGATIARRRSPRTSIAMSGAQSRPPLGGTTRRIGARNGSVAW